MQRITTPDGQVRDMGTVDILRDRERAVPRYTAFRRMLRMSVPKTFEELTWSVPTANRFRKVLASVTQRSGSSF
jgi:hypothetical protein